MTQSDKNIIAAAIAPNIALVFGLFAWMTWRVVTDQTPLSHGATSFVLGLCMVVPIGSAALANFARLRRDA
jgi:hypothetical protein